MVEPSRSSSRRALAATVAAALGLAGAGFVAGRATRAPTPVTTPTPEPSAVPTPIVAETPAPAQALGRADLIAAARAAADASASGLPLPADLTALTGRRFDLRLPFGCNGAAAPADALGWTFDKEAQTLRVRATPASFAPADWAAAAELVEGFWIEQPWRSVESCQASEAAAAPSERTLALAEVHGGDDSRVGRRDGEPFETVAKTAPDALDASQGLRLRLTGRLVAAPGSEAPVLCRATPAGSRPVCLLTVAFDEVAVENPATAATLATWSASGVAAPQD